MSLKKLLMAIVFTTISKHIRSNIKSRKFLRRIYIFIEERPTKQDIDIVQYQ
jgi:hypothetical protein